METSKNKIKDFKVGTLQLLLIEKEKITKNSIIYVDNEYYYVSDIINGCLVINKNQTNSMLCDVDRIDSAYTTLVTCNDHLTLGVRYLITVGIKWSIKKCETLDELDEVQGMPKILVYPQNIPEFILKNISNGTIQPGYYVKVQMETKTIETPQQKSREVRIPIFRGDKTAIIEKYIVGVDKQELKIFETAKAIAREIYMHPDSVGTGICFDNKKFEQFFIENKQIILKYK